MVKNIFIKRKSERNYFDIDISDNLKQVICCSNYLSQRQMITQAVNLLN